MPPPGRAWLAAEEQETDTVGLNTRLFRSKLRVLCVLQRRQGHTLMKFQTTPNGDLRRLISSGKREGRHKPGMPSLLEPVVAVAPSMARRLGSHAYGVEQTGLSVLLQLPK